MSSMSALLFGNMVTTDMTNYSTFIMTTEKSVEEFIEVKAAVLIDRIYIPFIFGFGMLGNSLSFITLVFTSLRTTSTCIYMAVVAVMDSIILTHAFCVLISRFIGDAAFFMHIDWSCGLQHFLFYFAIHFDVLLLLAVTVDRFIVVKYPLKAQTLCTPKSASKVITGLGLFSFALNFQIFFNKRLVPSRDVGNPLICWYPKGDIENFMEKIYTVIDATIYSFIPFLSLTTLNVFIIRELKTSARFSKQFTERKDGESSSQAKNKRGGTYNTDVNTSSRAPKSDDSGTESTKKAKASTNITLMLLLVSFGFLVLTSPMVIVLLYQRYHGRPKTNVGLAQFRLALTLVEITMYSNHAVNFLLYSISGRRFRQELKQLLTRLCCRT